MRHRFRRNPTGPTRSLEDLSPFSPEELDPYERQHHLAVAMAVDEWNARVRAATPGAGRPGDVRPGTAPLAGVAAAGARPEEASPADAPPVDAPHAGLADAESTADGRRLRTLTSHR